MQLKGRNVLLTGGSRGIGRVIAAALARSGARLGLVARSEESLAPVVASLRETGAPAVALPADLGDAGERERLVERAERELGGLDVLVNNAGVENEGAFLDVDWEVCGLRDGDAPVREMGVPREVQLRMGLPRRRPAPPGG